MIRERLATLSTLNRFPGEKPNTLVSTLWRIISPEQNKQLDGDIYAATERSWDGK
jgi:hypothetical protein